MYPQDLPHKLIVFLILVFFLFYKLSVNNVMEWDEARNALNAWEMYHNHDLINLYYGGELDTWNAKPPLLIWLITFFYDIFGFCEVALRLPSTIATLVFFFFFYRMVSRKIGEDAAFLSSLILLGCNAIVTTHIGISGDFDALLICFLTIATWFFIRFVDDGERKAIYLCAFFSGLAFYSKGTAALLFVPGWIVYVLVRRKGSMFFKSRHMWLSVLLFISIVASWTVLVMLYGKTVDTSFYGSKNSLETMLVHDTFRRLTADNFGQKPDYWFVLSSLDAKMNMWNYLFYAVLVIGGVWLVRKRKFTSFFRDEQNGLAVLSLCITLPVAIILTLATNKHYWYLAPVFPFVAIVTASGLLHIIPKWKPLYYVVGAFTVFALCWHFRDLHNIPTNLHSLLGKDSKYFTTSEKVITTHRPKQDVFLYITWSGKQQVYLSNTNDLQQYIGQTTILTEQELTQEVLNKLTDVTYFDGYVIAKVKP